MRFRLKFVFWGISRTVLYPLFAWLGYKAFEFSGNSISLMVPGDFDALYEYFSDGLGIGIYALFLTFLVISGLIISDTRRVLGLFKSKALDAKS